MTVLVLALAGGLGALARAEVAWLAARRGHPRSGTHAVNVLGALLLGLLVGARSASLVAADTVTVLGTGFLGGFTTFSTWMVQATADGDLRTAVRATVPVALVGVAAAALGAWLTGS